MPAKCPRLGWAAGRRGHLGQDGVDPVAVDQPSIYTLAVFGPLAEVTRRAAPGVHPGKEAPRCGAIYLSFSPQQYAIF